MADLVKLDGGTDDKDSSSIKINFTPVESKAPQEAGGNFEDIFNKATTKEKNSAMVSSIISRQDAMQKVRPILGAAPILEKSIEEEKTRRLEKKLGKAKFMFVAIFVQCASAPLYFYAQLSPNFDLLGTNPTHRLADINTNLKELQTSLNKYRYLAAQIDLTELSIQADRFFSDLRRFNSGDASMDKSAVLAGIEGAKKAMPELLKDIRANLGKDIVIPVFRPEGDAILSDDQIRQQFEEALRKALRDDRTKLAATNSLEDPKIVAFHQKFFENALKLVGNRALIPLLCSLNQMMNTFYQK